MREGGREQKKDPGNGYKSHSVYQMGFKVLGYHRSLTCNFSMVAFEEPTDDHVVSSYEELVRHYVVSRQCSQNNMLFQV